jgi:7-carboxy-7-deazaguanine synthase
MKMTANGKNFRVAEKFVSINGEGMRAGQLAVFIRFCGCNLRCSYCDTAWTWEYDAPDMMFEEMSAKEILAYIRQTGVRNVTLTGGEPLCRSGILDLLRLLASEEVLSVEIETNGSQDLTEICKMANRPHLTVDYKLPGSGMEQYMHLASFKLLDKRDVVKFVCGSCEDLQRACEIIREFSLVERTNVYLSAVFGRIEPAEIVEFMKEQCLNGVNLQLQMHKFIWRPDMKGV